MKVLGVIVIVLVVLVVIMMSIGGGSHGPGRHPIMTSGLRKFVLTAHIICSVGWLGAVVACLTLAIAAVISRDDQTMRAAWIALEATARFAIVPLALASVLIGGVNALGTPWGLFRHYWVLFKFALTVFATIISLLHVPDRELLRGRSDSDRQRRPRRAAGRTAPRRGATCWCCS